MNGRHGVESYPYNITGVGPLLKRAFAFRNAPAVAIVVNNSPGGSPVQSRHCSFILMNLPVMEAHKKELAPYDTSGSTIHFEASKPLPATLVRKLVKARIAQNERHAKK